MSVTVPTGPGERNRRRIEPSEILAGHEQAEGDAADTVPWFGLLRSGVSRGTAQWVHLVFAGLLVLVTTFGIPLDGPPFDSFHEGEYTIYGSLAVGGVLSAPPVFIHGGIDHIPPRIAARVCPVGHQIVCVRAINGIFITITAAAYLTVLLLMTGTGTWRAIIAGLPAMAMLIVYNGGARSVAMLQQGSPSIRELFIMLMLVCIALLSRHPGLPTNRSRSLFVAAIGALSGFGLFWAYNRGLAALILAGGSVGAFAVIWRDWRPLFFAAVGGAFGLAAASAIDLYGDFAGNVHNVLYWMANADLFFLARDMAVLCNLAIGVVIVAGLTAVGASFTWRQARGGLHQQAILPAALTGLIVLYAAQIHSRPDAIHLSWAIWPAALLAALLIRSAARTVAPVRQSVSIVAAAVLVSLAVSIYNIQAVPSLPERWATGITANIMALAAPSQADADLVSPGLREAAAVVRARGQRCTYAFSNDGLFYTVAQAPPCARFAYPVYVAPGYQNEIIADLNRNRPPIVLARSGAEWNSIDGIGLEQRTPVLAEWIIAHYPYRMTFREGYELRSTEPMTGSGK
jgi:hypothetical protein